MKLKALIGVGGLLMSSMALLVGCGWENTDTLVDGLQPPQPPEAVINVNADSGTAPLGVKFDSSSSSAPEGAEIVKYEWTFGDDSTDTGANVAHTYTSPGDYTAELTVTTNEGATDTDSVQISVRPNERPDPAFSHSPQSPRTNETVTFDASGSADAAGLSAQEIVSYRWNFGDGDTANGEVVEHRYDDDGDYDVMLTLTDDGDETASMTKTISVRNRSPEASIDADPTSGSAPLSVSFDASGSSDPDGLIQSYEWDFGDGDTGTGKTTSHSYADDGDFEVTLTVTDDDGATDSTTKTVSVQTVTVQNRAPQTSFTADPTSGTAPLTVNFDASSSSDPDGTLQGYQWQFGDGRSSSGETATHTYSDDGVYIATLTITDDDGATSTSSKNIAVSQEPKNNPPNASFDANPTHGSAPLTVSFVASDSSDSDGSIVNYEWDFGDGNSGAGETASHTYSDDGSYTATLTITDDDGATDRSSVEINVENPDPSASFTVSPENPEVEETVSFDASNSMDSASIKPKSIEQYAWDFGDGSSGSGKTTSHSYDSSGTYTIQLTVTDDDGAQSTAAVDVTVSQADQNDESNVIIDALLPNPVAEEPDEEWILVCNDSSATADISGWTLLDDNGSYSFPEGTTLESQECRTVYGSTYNPTGDTQELFLANAGETVRLRDSSGNEMDR